MTRGDVNSLDYARARDMKYFRSYDKNELPDVELAQKDYSHAAKS